MKEITLIRRLPPYTSAREIEQTLYDLTDGTVDTCAAEVFTSTEADETAYWLLGPRDDVISRLREVDIITGIEFAIQYEHRFTETPTPETKS